jgi:hypothetical protein
MMISPRRIFLAILCVFVAIGRSDAQFLDGLTSLIADLSTFFSSDEFDQLLADACPSVQNVLDTIGVGFTFSFCDTTAPPASSPASTPVTTPVSTPVAAPTKKGKVTTGTASPVKPPVAAPVAPPEASPVAPPTNTP